MAYGRLIHFAVIYGLSLLCCHCLDKISHPEENKQPDHRDNFLHLYARPYISRPYFRSFFSNFRPMYLHAHFLTNTQDTPCLYDQSILFEGAPNHWKQGGTPLSSYRTMKWQEQGSGSEDSTHLIGQVSFSFWVSFSPPFSKNILHLFYLLYGSELSHEPGVSISLEIPGLMMELFLPFILKHTNKIIHLFWWVWVNWSAKAPCCFDLTGTNA